MSGRPPTAGGPRLLLLLTRAVYRGLLRLYPGRLRRRFGASMETDAARLVEEEWRRGGVAGILRAWARILRDAVVSAPREWRRGKGGRAPVPDGVQGALPESRQEGRGRAAAFGDEVRAAIQGLRRSPGFTSVAVGVLGLGLTGVLVTLTVVDAYLLRGLPYPAAERLVNVVPGWAVPWEHVDRTVVEHAITWDLDALTLVDGERPELVRGAWISPGFAEAFGFEPALGRLFRPDEYGGGAPPVALLGWGLWQRRYGGDPAVLGSTISAFSADRPDEAEAFTVIGVLPRDLWYHNAYSEIYVPLREPNPLYMARLRRSVTLGDAERALTEVARRAGAELPATGIELVPFEEGYLARARPALLVLTAAVSLVLLLACANTAVLLLVRATGRQREFAVRQALGAAPGRLASRLLLEGLLLAGVAAVLGIALAVLVTRWLAEPLQARLRVGVPGGVDALAIGPGVLLGAGALTLVLGAAFGLAGLAGAGRSSPGAALAENARSFSESRKSKRIRNLLVGAELALSFTLLVGAGLSLRSARNLAATELGFDPRNRVTAQVNLRAAAYPDAQSRARFFDLLAEAARGLPGVEAAGLVIRVPFGWNFGAGPVEAEETTAATRPEEALRATGLVVGPGLLETLDVRLVRGRDLSPTDRAGSPHVAVVSRRFAERLWPGSDPLGRRFRELTEPGAIAHGEDARPGPWWTVVGVTEDIRHALEGEDAPDYYVPYAQLEPTSMTVVLHVRSGAASPIRRLEEAVRRLDPEVAVSSVMGLEEATLAARSPSRFLATVLAAFSAFALVLAVLGLYGVVAYAAARREREVAVRSALGAEFGQIVRLFIRDTVPVLALGLAVGVTGAALLGRLLASQLYGVSAWDASTWLVVAAVLTASATAAALLPASRAARTDPASVLREE